MSGKNSYASLATDAVCSLSPYEPGMPTEELGIDCLPSKANFVLAHVGPDAAECNEYLLRQGVIVRPVANYGLHEYLRITVGDDAELGRLLATMDDYRNSRA